MSKMRDINKRYGGLDLTFSQRKILAHWGDDFMGNKWQSMDALERKGVVRYFEQQGVTRVALTPLGVKLAKLIRKDWGLKGKTKFPLVEG